MSRSIGTTCKQPEHLRDQAFLIGWQASINHETRDFMAQFYSTATCRPCRRLSLNMLWRCISPYGRAVGAGEREQTRCTDGSLTSCEASEARTLARKVLPQLRAGVDEPEVACAAFQPSSPASPHNVNMGRIWAQNQPRWARSSIAHSQTEVHDRSTVPTMARSPGVGCTLCCRGSSPQNR